MDECGDRPATRDLLTVLPRSAGREEDHATPRCPGGDEECVGARGGVIALEEDERWPQPFDGRFRTLPGDGEDRLPINIFSERGKESAAEDVAHQDENRDCFHHTIDFRRARSTQPTTSAYEHLLIQRSALSSTGERMYCLPRRLPHGW